MAARAERAALSKADGACGVSPVRAVCVWALAAGPASAAGCPERPPCEGCGCKGGTGYRGPDGRCVGFRRLDAVCGSPPETRCAFENAPGTAENRDCALAPRREPAPIPGGPEPGKT